MGSCIGEKDGLPRYRSGIGIANPAFARSMCHLPRRNDGQDPGIHAPTRFMITGMRIWVRCGLFLLLPLMWQLGLTEDELSAIAEASMLGFVHLVGRIRRLTLVKHLGQSSGSTALGPCRLTPPTAP